MTVSVASLQQGLISVIHWGNESEGETREHGGDKD